MVIAFAWLSCLSRRVEVAVQSRRGLCFVNEDLKHTYIVHQHWMARDAHAGSEFNPVDRAIGFRGLGASVEVRKLLSS